MRRPVQPSSPDIAPRPPIIAPGVGIKKGFATPLLLLPMRLEYRIIKRSNPPRVVTAPEQVKQLRELRASLALLDPNDIKSAGDIQREIIAVTAKLKKTPLASSLARIEEREEIWFRWYPDDNFAEEGMAPPSPTETDALKRFLNHPSARYWPELRDPELLARWSELEAVAGTARAVHLVRTEGATLDENWEERIGRILGLPERVTLFAHTDMDLVQLGGGVSIPDTAKDWGRVSFNPEVLAEGNWLTDFDVALERGMGVKLSDPSAIEAARKADWIIAVGTSEDSAADLEAYLKDQIASGGLEILPAHTATNNALGVVSGGGRSATSQGRLYDHAQLEAGSLQEDDLDGRRLADGLGVAPRRFEEPAGALTADHREQAAMIRVIGPALLDDAASATSILNGMEDIDLIDLLAQHVQATGVYPALRFGDTAYGVLPLTQEPNNLVFPEGFKDDDIRFARFVRRYRADIAPKLGRHSANLTPRIEPEDPDASEKMIDILQTTRISRRLDVSDLGSDDIAGLGCPYVAGEKEDDQPGRYFSDLIDRQLKDIPKPDETDRTTPLLSRLAILSLRRIRLLEVLKGTGYISGRGNLDSLTGNWRSTLPQAERRAINQSRNLSVRRFSVAPPSDTNFLPSGRLPALKQTNSDFLDAVRTLRGIGGKEGGTERLEALMMSTIDLFQHRLDAWITGLASLRLHHLRKTEGVSGLSLGYYGFIGALREDSGLGPADGYLQAPSLGQAHSAAILRSAYLRGKDGDAFKIDLSSARTERALKIMDHLRRGVSLPQCLGMRGERWLRNDLSSNEIAELRANYPIVNIDVDGSGESGRAGVRTFDGLALVAAKPDELSAKQSQVRAVLADDLDALSDVIVAEAVHHRAGGSADTAAAWLRVLSGGPIPDRPEFLRTERSGHSSDYRVSLVLPQGQATQQDAPLVQADPALNALFSQTYRAIVESPISVEITLGEQPVFKGEVSLGKDLNLTAMQAAKMGEDAIRTALERYVPSLFAASTPVSDLKVPLADRTGLHAAGAKIECDLKPISTQLSQAADLWKIVQSAQPLSAGDLSNAADPAKPLTELAHVTSLNASADALWERASDILAWLGGRYEEIIKQTKTVFGFVEKHYARDAIAWGDQIEADERLQTLVTTLNTSLLPLIGLGLGEPIRLQSAARMTSHMVDEQARIRALTDALRKRYSRLRSAIAQKTALRVTLSEARGDLAAATEALRIGCGTPQLSIFPPVIKTTETTPLLSESVLPETALESWPRYRRKLNRILSHLNEAHEAFKVLPAATEDDKDAPDKDMRSEELSPRSYHFGVLIGRERDVLENAICGVVIDEWGEVRPSAEQKAAIALNYDAPQSEAPNCLLLCVPATPIIRGWSDHTAAAHVTEAIELMKMRALSTQTTQLNDTVLPRSNQIPPVRKSGVSTRSLPVAKYAGGLRDWTETMGNFQQISDADLIKTGGIWPQTGPFRRPKRGGK